jgi:hypothetical protein
VPRWFRKRAIPRIRSAEEQAVLPRSTTIDQLKLDMLTGRFRYESWEGQISGWIDKETYFISEGHHRVNAALEIYWETGDRSYLDRLLEHGRWSPATPPRSRVLPTRRLVSKILKYFGL